MGLARVLALPLPTGSTWLWLLGSAGLHSSYKIFLTQAYQRGDLSRVYPIARGTAPMIVAVVGAVFLSDIISVHEYLGILLIACGVMVMARGVFRYGESRQLLLFALGAATMTAGYTMVDGLGARGSGAPTVFVAWMFLLDGIGFLSWALIAHGRGSIPVRPRVWVLGTLAGAASYGAYWIAVWAMTKAPIALVGALRETSVLFAVAIGVLFFRERADRGKIAAAALILTGVVLARL